MNKNFNNLVLIYRFYTTREFKMKLVNQHFSFSIQEFDFYKKNVKTIYLKGLCTLLRVGMDSELYEWSLDISSKSPFKKLQLIYPWLQRYL